MVKVLKYDRFYKILPPILAFKKSGEKNFWLKIFLIEKIRWRWSVPMYSECIRTSTFECNSECNSSTLGRFFTLHFHKRIVYNNSFNDSIFELKIHCVYEIARNAVKLRQFDAMFSPSSLILNINNKSINKKLGHHMFSRDTL